MKRKLELKVEMNELSDDILLDIFEYLDKESTETAVKVCERWQNLILNSSKLSSKPTMFSNFAIFLRREITTSQRISDLLQKSQEFPYRNFHFSFLFDSDDYDAEEFSNYVSEVTDGRAERMMFNDMPIFMIIRGVQVNQMSLKQLEVSSERRVHLIPADLCCVELKNLKILKICEVYSLLKILKCENLEDFSLNTLPRVLPSEAENLRNFLKNCPKLKKLRLVDYFPNLDELPFNLNSLELENTRRSLEDFLVNLKTILTSQGKSLKHLKIYNSIEDFRAIMNLINENTKLISLDVNGWCNEDYREEILFRNNSVRKLRINIFAQLQGRLHGRINARHLLKTLKDYPQVEDLTIHGFYDNFSRFIRKANFTNLKSLQINTYNSINLHYHEISIKNLTKLTIDSIHNENSARLWTKMISFFPNLKHLVVKRWSYKAKNKQKQLRGSILQKLLKCALKVEEITIEECLNMPVGFIDYLKERNSNLKMLRISVKKVKDIEILKQQFKGAKFEYQITYAMEIMRTKWHCDPQFFKERGPFW